jgi:hypothetical protein
VVCGLIAQTCLLTAPQCKEPAGNCDDNGGNKDRPDGDHRHVPKGGTDGLTRDIAGGHLKAPS